MELMIISQTVRIKIKDQIKQPQIITKVNINIAIKNYKIIDILNVTNIYKNFLFINFLISSTNILNPNNKFDLKSKKPNNFYFQSKIISIRCLMNSILSI
jgi:hypothetical protein